MLDDGIAKNALTKQARRVLRSIVWVRYDGTTVRSVEELAEFSPVGVLVEINADPPGGIEVGRRECSAVFQERVPVTGVELDHHRARMLYPFGFQL